MQQLSFAEYTNQCTRTDLAFFDLLRSIAELHAYQHELSAEDIAQLQIGARTLNGIIARNTTTNHSIQLV
ncbi:MULTISPECIES: hypothetical protein [Legionella]|jgi:hypothetical protein|uniref:Uncharacterized protein n=2 Tax=Legionella TaxID=445 RepID=A0A0W1AM82_9GAMM|nr:MULTISPECIES: hypothetical protein [Legionella]MBN9229527.1 hypothetical protein [Legionella sp.]HAT9067695.1 hypothetical protein [Legionella pneumophila subsp. pneumophila]KTD82461.1 hypothetical protein Lwal_0938 [Legionella waltersii]MCZ4799251.1 hypothetical protein [Legionella pneumophila]MDW9185964.1 hypothetical protein [Legionella pneumophila]